MQTFGLRHLLNKQAPEDRMDTLRVWRIALAVTLGIGLLKHLPLAAGLAGLAAAATQLYLPLRYALTAPGGDDGIGYNLDGLKRDLPIILAILLLTCIPFWFAHEWWWTWQGVADGSGSKLLLPASDLADWLRQRGVRWTTLLQSLALLELSAIHLLGVALPEELFYRGFLQPRLCRSFKDRKLAWGFVWNHGILIAAILFAAAHFLGEYNPARLAPFFPALLFGMLRRRSGSIAGAVLLHGAFNIVGALLFAGVIGR